MVFFFVVCDMIEMRWVIEDLCFNEIVFSLGFLIVKNLCISFKIIYNCIGDIVVIFIFFFFVVMKWVIEVKFLFKVY